MDSRFFVLILEVLSELNPNQGGIMAEFVHADMAEGEKIYF